MPTFNFARIVLMSVAIFFLHSLGEARGEDLRAMLWDGVRNGDAKAVAAALDKGADVNAKNEIGVTAIWISTNKGNMPITELLVKRGADANSRDGNWYQTPLGNALANQNFEMTKFLLKTGAKNVEEFLIPSAARGRLPYLKLFLENRKIDQDVLDGALLAAPASNKDVRDLLVKAGAKPMTKLTAEQKESLKPFVGNFENDNGAKVGFEIGDYGLLGARQGTAVPLKPLGNDQFRQVGTEAIFQFTRSGEKVTRVTRKYFTSNLGFYRFEEKPAEIAKGEAALDPTAVVAKPANWPMFRGIDASGVADGQHPPTTWDVKKGINVRWKTPIPGLGHSCPVIWGNRVFLTTAISGKPDQKLQIGNYGDPNSVDDTTKHTWQILCLDRDTGKIEWTRTCIEGVPKIKRHLKGSQANCTPVTDGKRIICCFGSEGLYCYDFQGKQLWKRDLGTLDSSFAVDVRYEWGFASSPIIHQENVILQCDLGKDSFIAAYKLEDGSQAWSTPRDEIPSWSTPIIWKNANRTELVTNASQYARGYDPETGKELWRLDKKSDVTVPTPVTNSDLAFVMSGNRPIQPIYAVKPGATGDISLTSGTDKNQHVAWSKLRGGPYMPSPIVYGGHLYTCGNSGIVNCYDASTGVEIYKQRLGGSSYTASPVAADGKIYFITESGEVRVVKAGPKFALLAKNDMDDYCMASPAISNGSLFVRTQHALYSLAANDKKTTPQTPGKAAESNKKTADK